MPFGDFFRPAQPAAKPNTQQQQPNQQQQQQQTNQPTPNGQQPPNGQNPNPNEPVNPMDVYGKMFDNQPNEGDKPPAFSIDPKVMDQVVGSQDFMQGVDPELMTKAMGGDAQSMTQLLNHVGRAAYRSSIEHGGVLTDKFVGSYNQYSSKQLPGQLKSQLTEQALGANTPNFKHPVIRQQLTEVAQRLSKTHPDATPQEIAEMSKKYLSDLSSALNGDKSQEQNSGKSKETDWDSYFADESNG